MKTYYVYPSITRDEFRKTHGGIKGSLEAHTRLLPKFGWVESQDPENADLVVGYLSVKTRRLDVFHLRGLYPTGAIEMHPQFYRSNAQIITNIRRARQVIVVSDWVAEILQRDLHMQPVIIPGHGLDLERWDEIEPHQAGSYALWNKTRRFGVCDPQPVLELAKRFPEYQFVTTFLPRGEAVPPNVKVTGLLPYEDAWRIVKGASIYLATTKETFGRGTLEAMASRCRIIGFHWGASPDVMGPTGILVPPNDYDALALAFAGVIDAEPDDEARERVREHYRWEDVVAQTAATYDKVLEDRDRTRPKVSVIIPVHNYTKYVETAISSVLSQTFQDWELIVVDDGSTDDSAEKAQLAIADDPRCSLVQQANAGVAHARNNGIGLSHGEYICCLDADDAIASTFLDTVVPVLDEDRTLGIAYTGIELMDSKNRLRGRPHTWPRQYKPGNGLLGNQVPTCCLFRKDYWTRLGGYRQRYAPHGAGQEDADFWFRILANGGGAKMVVGEHLFYYRTHGKQTTRVHKTDWKRNEYQGWHPVTTDGRHLVASQLGVPQFESWPVYDYDCPVISVIVPVGPGHENILLDALDSIEAQTFREWELIVVNDSGAVLDLTPWPYARVVNTDGGKGAGFARNRGAEIAKGDLLVFLDADDFLQPEFLRRTYDAWQQTGYWVYTNVYTVGQTGETDIFHCEDFSVRKLWRSGLAAVTCLHSKAMWEKVGGFDELLQGREDWDFHLRLAKAGFCGIKVDEPLFTYRHSTGWRRRIGLRNQEAKALRERYDLEELMAGCSGCGRGVTLRTNPRGKKVKPVNWQTKADLGWPLLEYIGKNSSELVFKGRTTGRVYKAGNNKYHKLIRVHPDDTKQLLALTCFRLKETETLTVAPATSPAPVATAVPAPAVPAPAPVTPAVAPPTESPAKPPAPSKSSKSSKGNGKIDIDTLSIRVLRDTDLAGQDLEALIQAERQGRSRRTIMAHLRLEQRKQAAEGRLT